MPNVQYKSQMDMKPAQFQPRNAFVSGLECETDYSIYVEFRSFHTKDRVPVEPKLQVLHPIEPPA